MHSKQGAALYLWSHVGQADRKSKEMLASKNDVLHNIQCIANKELPYIYGVMLNKQTVKAKKCKPPRMTFYIIFNA